MAKIKKGDVFQLQGRKYTVVDTTISRPKIVRALSAFMDVMRSDDRGYLVTLKNVDDNHITNMWSLDPNLKTYKLSNG